MTTNGTPGSTRRFFSADSDCVITDEQVKQNLATRFHAAWDQGMARPELGVENVLWSTDFPHPCCNWPNAAAMVDPLFQGVPQEEIHEITWQNGATMYGIA